MATIEDSEKIRYKYKILLNDLQKIRNEMKKLSTNNQSFIELLEDTVQINEKMFENEEINNIRKELDYLKKDLNDNLISRVANKI
jgi:hypothetical protein